MRKAAVVFAAQTFFWLATPLLVSMVTFTTYALIGNELTAEKVFTSLGKIIPYIVFLRIILYSSLQYFEISIKYVT